MHYTKEMCEKIMRKNNGNLNLLGEDVTSLPNNLTVGGYLNLSETPITSLPDNLTVGGDLDLSRTRITSLPDNLTVGGDLDLSGAPITLLPDNLTVGSWLDLSGTPITSLPENLKVGGSLDLSGTRIISLPDNLTVGGSLYLSRTPITSLPNNLTVGYSLYLGGSRIASLPNELAVGGSLDLKKTRITSLPDNLTVGGYLNLSWTQITSLPDNLTVGYKVYCDRTVKNPNHYKHLHNGDYVEGKYLYADGILTHVKRAKTIGKYTYYVGKIPGKNVIFDGDYYAHCKKFSEGVKDLAFKHAKDRGADQYKRLSLDSEVSADDAIVMYRVITGACKAGTENFVNSLGKLKEAYTVRELISITHGQYGAEVFEAFFAA